MGQCHKPCKVSGRNKMNGSIYNVKADNPDMNSKEINAKLGRMWKEEYKGTDKAERFVKLADEDKKRYVMEKADWSNSTDDDEEKSKPIAKKSSAKKRQKEQQLRWNSAQYRSHTALFGTRYVVTKCISKNLTKI